MTIVLLALLIAAAGASYAYLVRERLGLAGAGLAALRWFGLALLVLLVANPVWPGDRAGEGSTVLLDRSLSMRVAGAEWDRALDTARALAGADGRILGFGSRPGPLRDTVPDDGVSLLEPALRAVRGLGGTVYVVTDGEVRDGGALAPGLLAGVRSVLVPRVPQPGAALTRVSLPPTVADGDTIPIRIEITTWGGLAADSGRIEVWAGERRLVSRAVAMPSDGGTAVRHVRVPAGALGAGLHALDVRLDVPGDAEHRDDTRVRILSILDEPPAVIVADPATWDARFVYQTLASVSGLPVRGFARVTDRRWVDMATGQPTSGSDVRGSVGRAALVVASGSGAMLAEAAPEAAVWYWRSPGPELTAGDWYVVDRLPASPLAGRLARIEWDSVPPLTALAPEGARDDGQAVLQAWLGRRGPTRPVLVAATGTDRRLETRATGFYRWSLRGGSSLEAFRALVSSGVDWLLRASREGRPAPLHVSRTVTRGVPVTFRWVASDPPDSLELRLSEGEATRTVMLELGPNGSAELHLMPGTYRWYAEPPGVGGLLAVEAYSDEFVPGPITLKAGEGAVGRESGADGYLRERWWVFLLAIAALVFEWAWRQRRGLP